RVCASSRNVGRRPENSSAYQSGISNFFSSAGGRGGGGGCIGGLSPITEKRIKAYTSKSKKANKTAAEMITPTFPVALRLASIPHASATNSRGKDAMRKYKPPQPRFKSFPWKTKSSTSQHPGNT